MIKPSEFSKPRKIEYPTSDGKPMAETDIHRDVMFELIELLKWWYRAEQHVYVSGNLLVFYKEGDKRKHLSPDVFVVKGVDDHFRDNYLMWEEGHGLDLVIEVTSKSTRSNDLGKKRDLYLNELGVQEYFLFDPYEEYLKPSLQGFRRTRGEFIPIDWEGGRLSSTVLNLHLEREGNRLRLWNPTTGDYLLTERQRREQMEVRAKEMEERAKEEKLLRERMEERTKEEILLRERMEERAKKEKLLREQADQNIQLLKAELEKLRAERRESST